MTTAPASSTSSASAAAAAPAQTITERLVIALTAAWRAIQANHPEVPDVVLTLGSGTLGKRGGETTLGHFAAGRWQLTGEKAGQAAGLHELFVSGEGLSRGSDEVLATLGHEAAHGLAAVRGISDTSRQGRYHNKRFKALAEELGLAVDEDGTRGWSATTLAEGTEQHYAATLGQLAEALSGYQPVRQPRTTAKTGSTVRPKRWQLAAAECACPRKIRVARGTLAEAPITCGACNQQFVLVDDPEASSAADSLAGA